MVPVDQKLKPLTVKELQKTENLRGKIKFWAKQAGSRVAGKANNSEAGLAKKFMQINHYRPLSFTLKMQVAQANITDRYYLCLYENITKL